jgi:hypothetical protein
VTSKMKDNNNHNVYPSNGFRGARLVVLRDTKLLSLNTGRKAIISFRQEYI